MQNLFINYFIFIFIQQAVFAEDKIPAGARSASLGMCSVSLNDFWSVVNNQAIMADYKHLSTGFYYENRFLQKELAQKSVAFLLPTKYGTLGLNHTYWGYSKYHEQKTGLGYSRQISGFLSLGIQLDYISRYIAEGYGKLGSGTFEAGMYGKLSRKLFLGAHLFNPIHSGSKDFNNEIAPTTFRFGLTYLSSDKITTIIETEKELRFDPAIRSGIEYKVHERASVRLGFSTIPRACGMNDSIRSSLLTFGFGTLLGKLRIDLASSFHTMLGSSLQFSMHYQLK